MILVIKINKDIVAEVPVELNSECSFTIKEGLSSSSGREFYEKELNYFDEARKLYPGKKRGLQTEFLNFRKKHKDWREALPKLYSSISLEIEEKTKLKYLGRFVPEWKNFQTWINNRCWEMYISEENKPEKINSEIFNINFKKVE